MSPPRTDKAPDKSGDADAAVAVALPRAFVSGRPASKPAEIRVGLPARQARSTDAIVRGADLSGRTVITVHAGRGKTGKTTAIRLTSELALAGGRQLIMGDLDPSNPSFASYFEGVHAPEQRDDPILAARFFEELVNYAIEERTPAGIDMGGGNTVLSRVAAELPELPRLAEENGAAIVLLLYVGHQVDDLGPLATLMQYEGFKPAAIGVVKSEASVPLGVTRDDAYAPIHEHSIYQEALSRGAVPVWMPRLAVADQIELHRVGFLAARDGAMTDGRAILGPTDRLRLRNWIAQAEANLAGIRSWLP